MVKYNKNEMANIINLIGGDSGNGKGG